MSDYRFCRGCKRLKGTPHAKSCEGDQQEKAKPQPGEPWPLKDYLRSREDYLQSRQRRGFPRPITFDDLVWTKDSVFGMPIRQDPSMPEGEIRMDRGNPRDEIFMLSLNSFYSPTLQATMKEYCRSQFCPYCNPHLDVHLELEWQKQRMVVEDDPTMEWDH